MRDSVNAAWFDSIRSYEGYTNWLYFDTHKPPLATTGVGNMIDTGNGLSNFGLALPWRDKDGDYATESQIKAEYNRLEALGISAQGGFAYQKHASLFLDESVIKWMVFLKTDEFWSILAKTFPDIEKWPADAQMAIMNMAWWMGPRFTDSWPTLTGALRAQDFVKAALNCTTVNPSARNPHNVARFRNAARVRFLWGTDTALEDRLFGIKPIDGMPTVDVSNVIAALPNVKSVDALRVQDMLKVAGAYTSVVDGLFGKLSKAAWNKWSGDKAMTIDTLTKLSNETLLYDIVA